jgi:hypothetical protein
LDALLQKPPASWMQNDELDHTLPEDSPFLMIHPNDPWKVLSRVSLFTNTVVTTRTLRFDGISLSLASSSTPSYLCPIALASTFQST